MTSSAWVAAVARLISIGVLLLSSMAGQASVAAADPLCPGNGSATLDPTFEPLVDRVGASVVGSVSACIYKSGSTGIFSQQTTLGTLVHNLDGSLTFVTSTNSAIPNQKWSLRKDGTFVAPDAVPGAVDPARPLTPPAALLPADDPAVTADDIVAGHYFCYARLGGGSSRQVNRSVVTATKDIYADGTWRDTTYGNMTANNPAYGGNWDFDGDTLTLTWNDGAEDLFTPEIRTSGQPQLVEYDEPENNVICYLN